MLWRTHSTSGTFWLLSTVLLLFLLGGKTEAQGTIYSWIDEKGVVHFSNSMIPPQHVEHATTVETPSRAPSRASGTDTSDSIPLVILNDDPSQKFVRAELAGEQDSREVLMLVDTGAQITLIDQPLAEELALEHIDNALLTGVTGSAVGWIGRLPILRLGQAEVRDLSVMVGPMRGRLLLGMDVLERLELSVGPRSLQRARP
ncbi:MAG TPA: retroviral-like aspartic protease family protein [Candidatus Binatia bacterium]|nr:retroviral-like aspartic protease family protein [Candidatus Binatia bacterium]